MAKNKLTTISTIDPGSKRGIVGKQKPILGIDIGSSTIKIVKMDKNHEFGKWVLESTPTGMINQGRIEAIEPLADIIRDSLKTYRINVKDCALYISGSEVIVREFLLPEMEHEQLLANVSEEIFSMLPVDHEEYSIDYKILEYIKDKEDELGQFRVLVGAVPRGVIDDYVLTLKKAGLKVKYIDVLPNISGKLCNYIYESSHLDKRRNICMLDFGANKTEMIILRNGNYYLHKLINYGGEYLTSRISSKAGMDLIEAEEYKCKTDFFAGNRETAVKKEVQEYFELLNRDFLRTIEFYSNRSHENVDRIYLMGGGSLLIGLPEFLQDQLSIEVRPISDIFEDYQKVGAVGRHISIFAQAIGVTFREEWK